MGFDVRKNPDVIERSHTTSAKTRILAKDITTTDGTFRKGTPVKFLKNRVMDLPSWINQNLKEGGVLASDLEAHISNNKDGIFDTQREQLRKFLAAKNLQPAAIGKVAEQTYQEIEDEITKSIIDQLKDNPNKMITDADLEKIVDKAYTPLVGSREPLLTEFNKAINKSTVLRYAETEDMIKAIKAKGATPITDFGGKMPKTAYLEQLLKLEGVPDNELNKYIQYTGNRAKEVTGAFGLGRGKLSSVFYQNAIGVIKAAKKKNAGGSILGSTNKDTVPAMLTPGEFVINRKSAQANMPLLNAINNGQRLNKGGMVKNGVLYANNGTTGGVTAGSPLTFGATPQRSTMTSQAAFVPSPTRGGMLRGALPTVAGIGSTMLLFQPLMDAGNKLAGTMGGLALSLAGTTVISGALQFALKRMLGTPIKLSEQFSMTSKVLSKIAPAMRFIGVAGTGWIAAISGAAFATYKVVQTMKNVENAGARLSQAMSGGVNSVNNMAAAFGRQTPTQRLTALKAQAAGGAIGQEAQQQASQFMGTDAAKQILKDIETAKKNGQDAAELLRNQLTRSVLAGVITPEEARGVAVEIGNALNDQKLAVDASGRITQLIGPNGELIKDNRVKIIGEIAPTIDPASLKKIAEDQYKAETSGFWGPLTRLVDNESKAISINTTKALASGISNYALIQKQNMDALEVQLYDGQITLEQYNKEVEQLDKNARDFNAEALTSFIEITGSNNLEEFNRVLKETKEVDSLAGTGVVTVPTAAAAAAQKQVEDQVKQMQDAYFAQMPNIKEEEKKAILDGMKEAFGGTESTDIILGWAQLLGGYISVETVKGLAGSGAPDGVMNKAGLDARNKTSKLKEEAAANAAKFGGTPPVDDGQESAWERIKRETEETKKYSAAVQGLLGSGLKPQNIALLSQADLLEMSNSQRKEAIKLLKDQQDASKVLSFVLMSTEEQNIKNLNDAVKIKDYQISQLQREIDKKERLNDVEQDRIDKLSRQNELDNRQIDLRNRAIDQITKKEETVNSIYDARFAALDKVAQANDRIAQQQQGRISLAGALTGGDFGAAASAAAQMSANYATAQLEDTRSALENQRQSELASLTAEVNGQLLTKQQIQTQIDEIGERIYQRDLQIQQLEDVIYQREQESIPYKLAIRDLEDQRLKLTQQIEDAEFNRWKTELDGINKAILAYNEYWKSKTKGTGKTVGGPVKASQAMSFGGFIKAANGMEVPGTGITDKVPALLTPGEFVVRKSVAQANMPLLKALNSDIFPSMSSLDMSPEVPVSETAVSTVNAPVYNNYSVNVNVADTNASADDIATAVVSRIKMSQGRSIRGSRI
jgi:hypothetical protein